MMLKPSAMTSPSRAMGERPRLLSQVTPDLVVMDWRTPGLSGLSLCLALRRRWPMIPIVVVTSGGGNP